MAAFDKSAKAEFHRRLARFLRAEVPEATAAFEDAGLLQRIAESERRASTYGIESDAGIAQFACLTFVAGPAFDEIPEVREYLQEQGMDPEKKLEELVDYLAALEDEGSLE
jgi:hypothetical protein